MKPTQIYRRFSAIQDAFPVKFSALIVVILFVFAYLYLNNNYSLSENSTQAVFTIIAKYFLIILITIILIAFLSCLAAYVVFRIRLKRNSKYLNISFDINNSSKNKVESLAKIQMQKLLFPLFGCIKVRFFFENNFSSKKINLVSNKFRLMSTKNFTAECALNFNEVKHYTLKHAKFYFEDYFSLFSFSSSKKANAQFYVLPEQKQQVNIFPNPTAQQDAQIRTDIVRYLNGEFLRFKSFENSDDVRRIVWKIFAKNNELVVRTQEMRNNQASKTRLYASFFNNMNLLLQTGNLSNLLLTFYKNAVWSVFSALKNNKKMDTELKIDTDINVNASKDSLPKQMFEISAAEWQDSLPPADFYESGNVSVLCISSLVVASDVKKILDKKSKYVSIIFVQLGKVLKVNAIKLIIRNIFVKPQRGSIEEQQLKFLLSPIRKRLLANEKAIIEILNGEDDNLYII